MPPQYIPPPLNRLIPRLGPEYYRSYTRSMPLASHWKKVSCEEYECDDFLNGFVLTVDVSTELGEKQRWYIERDKTRSPSMQRVSLTVFKYVYPAGTPGFAGVRHDHYMPTGREPIWFVSGGDWRGNPRRISTRVHTRPEFWVEDFAGNQEVLAGIEKKG